MYPLIKDAEKLINLLVTLKIEDSWIKCLIIKIFWDKEENNDT